MPLVAERRRDPQHDVISTLATTQLDGQSLSDEEIVSFLRFLLEAGAETTYRSSSNLFFGLLSQPERPRGGARRPARSCRGPSKRPCDGSPRSPGSSAVPRSTPSSPAWRSRLDRFLAVNVGAANRDETRWENPEVFDIHREQVPHIAFGFGAHLCLGMHLARSEMVVALNAVLDRLPNVRLDPAADDVHISGSTFRAPRALPVLFDG